MVDIIIPTYKNKQGLLRTLESINTDLLSQFVITIIDDCSNLNYQDIKIKFPYINLYILQKNVGPGLARQFGIEHTKQPYILFIDTEDVFYNFNVQIQMLKYIINNPQIYLFSWKVYNDNYEQAKQDNHNWLHGRIYKRNFLQKYNVTFCKKGSYANEDVGFNRFLRIILQVIGKNQHYLFIPYPLIIWTKNEDSLTRKNYNSFSYHHQNLGLAYNEQHTVLMLINNNISQQLIQKEADVIMISLYKNFYMTLQQCPKFIQNSWEGAKYFYDKVYYKYEKTKSSIFNQHYSKVVQWQKLNSHRWYQDIPININHFLKQLKKYEKVPPYYLTFTKDYDIINK